MIEYTESTDGIEPAHLPGFFVGWPKPPSPETHLKILQRSSHVVLAIDRSTDRVVGFINALTDGMLSAYIPLLEVLPEYQKQGIGRELVTRMMARLDALYMVDLLCDPPLAAFYNRFGLKSAHAMALRNYERQSGEA